MRHYDTADKTKKFPPRISMRFKPHTSILQKCLDIQILIPYIPDFGIFVYSGGKD